MSSGGIERYISAYKLSDQDILKLQRLGQNHFVCSRCKNKFSLERAYMNDINDLVCAYCFHCESMESLSDGNN